MSSAAEDVVVLENEELFWLTPDSLSIEVLASPRAVMEQFAPGVNQTIWTRVVRLFQSPSGDEEREWLQRKPPLLFIHGSFHGAWCFSDWIQYFSALGHECFAVSLRGTSTTGMPPADPGEVVQIEDHVGDMKSALSSLREKMAELYGAPAAADAAAPVIVAHSFGGVVAMKLLEDPAVRDNVRGVCLLASVPPSGNGPMTQRFLFKRFFDSLLIVWGFVFKRATTDPDVCRKLFFDSTVPDADIERYMTRFRADSRVTLDVASLTGVLPSKTSMGPDGRATWIREGNHAMPALVVGGEKDFVVDREGVQEAARYFATDPVIIPDTYHDVMLGPKQNRTAAIIADWLATLPQVKSIPPKE